MANWLADVRRGWRDGQVRADQAKAERRMAEDALVLDAITRMGRAGGYDLSKETGLRSARLYLALARLEADGLIVGEWETPEPVGRPVGRFYVAKGER